MSEKLIKLNYKNLEELFFASIERYWNLIVLRVFYFYLWEKIVECSFYIIQNDKNVYVGRATKQTPPFNTENKTLFNILRFQNFCVLYSKGILNCWFWDFSPFLN